MTAEIIAHGDALGVDVRAIAELLARRGEEAILHVALDCLEEGVELPPGIYLTPKPEGHPPALVTLEQCLGRRQMAPPVAMVRYGWSAAPHIWVPCEDRRPPWTWRRLSEHVRLLAHPSGLTGAWDVRGRGSASSVARRCRDEALSRLLTRTAGVTPARGVA